ncbi:hypothetical protein P4O66_012417, partial [Electrophorus voltai]
MLTFDLGPSSSVVINSQSKRPPNSTAASLCLAVVQHVRLRRRRRPLPTVSGRWLESLQDGQESHHGPVRLMASLFRFVTFPLGDQRQVAGSASYVVSALPGRLHTSSCVSRCVPPLLPSEAGVLGCLRDEGWELEEMWKVKAPVVPMVTATLGAVPSNLGEHLQQISGTTSEVSVQKSAVLGTDESNMEVHRSLCSQRQGGAKTPSTRRKEEEEVEAVVYDASCVIKVGYEVEAVVYDASCVIKVGYEVEAVVYDASCIITVGYEVEAVVYDASCVIKVGFEVEAVVYDASCVITVGYEVEAVVYDASCVIKVGYEVEAVVYDASCVITVGYEVEAVVYDTSCVIKVGYEVEAVVYDASCVITVGYEVEAVVYDASCVITVGYEVEAVVYDASCVITVGYEVLFTIGGIVCLLQE